MERSPFFSIVIPAHNEERYIAETTAHVVALNYPKDRYEVLVVENGSSDGTRAAAEAVAGGNIRVLSFAQKGAAFARNRGAEAASQDAAWILFLDADTLLAPSFLSEVAAFLEKHEQAGYACGTVEVRPGKSSFLNEFFFLWSNGCRALSKAPYTAFFIRQDVFPLLPPLDESRQVGEDIELFDAARAHGKAFFMRTRSVRTSMRRFEKIGLLTMIGYWLLVMPLPSSVQRRLSYDVVR
jgi:glycosyltransferase involved in cell wall biosynthesis